MAEDEPTSPMATPARQVPLSGKAFRPRAARIFAAVFVLALLSVSIIPLNKYLSSNWWNYLFLAEAALLCILTPFTCGLVFRKALVWRQRVHVVIVWLVPPLLVLTVYAPFTSKPFHGAAAEMWLVQSVAQEFLFTGFVYGRLCELWGAPEMSWRGAFAWPMLVTPLLFACWHWGNALSLPTSYFLFQLLYTVLGGWWSLNLRRWTGSLWLNVTLHVAVNWLASIL